MKVAVIGWEIPPLFTGGLGIHTYNLFGELSKFIDIDLYVPNLGSLYDHYPFNVIPVEIGIKGKLGNYGSISYDFYGAVNRYNSLIGEINDLRGAEIIHCHDWITFRAGIELKEKFNLPLVLTVHSTEIDRSGGFYPQRWIMDIEREGMEMADRIIAVSHYTKKLIMNIYNIPSHKIYVVHNGVGKRFLSLPEKDYKSTGNVLYFGRITTQKGPFFFVEAAAKAIEMQRNLKFVIAGTGDLLDETKELAKRMLPEGSYDFKGFVDYNEAFNLYRNSDVFVLPAVSEPFGITVLESMCSGTPAIISKTTGVGESLRNVFRADFWDTDLIAEYIAGTVKYKALRKTMGIQGMIEARGFTWERAAMETLEVYKGL